MVRKLSISLSSSSVVSKWQDDYFQRRKSHFKQRLFGKGLIILHAYFIEAVLWLILQWSSLMLLSTKIIIIAQWKCDNVIILMEWAV